LARTQQGFCKDGTLSYGSVRGSIKAGGAQKFVRVPGAKNPGVTLDRGQAAFGVVWKN